MNYYFHEVKKLAESCDAVVGKRAALSLSSASKKRPRILVCAPSNAAVDNVILKIMEDGFVDGNGCRYNPSIVRIGRGQSVLVKDVCLEVKVESYITDSMDAAKLECTVEGFKTECRRLHADISKLRHCMSAMKSAASYPLAKDWEIRINEDTSQVYFVNHKEKTTTFETPPPPEPGQRHFSAEAMPEYKIYVSRVVKMVERYNNLCTKIERYSLCSGVAAAMQGGANCHAMNTIRQQIETNLLDSTHIVTTTLGTAGNRSLESAAKFEVVVIDECAQSVEPSTLAGLQLGSKHAILVGDPQQLPATIFNVSGRNSKYDRSLFQRLEEAGHEVHLLDMQYRMNPLISEFPRKIFYSGQLFDGDNVKHPEYGNPLKREVFRKFPAFQVSQSRTVAAGFFHSVHSVLNSLISTLKFISHSLSWIWTRRKNEEEQACQTPKKRDWHFISSIVSDEPQTLSALGSPLCVFMILCSHQCSVLFIPLNLSTYRDF